MESPFLNKPLGGRSRGVSYCKGATVFPRLSMQCGVAVRRRSDQTLSSTLFY